MKRGKSFQPGNPGRPKGSKNRQPPIAMRIRGVEQLGPRFFDVMKQAAHSRFKSDRRWFAERYIALLPREDKLTLSGGQKLEIIEELVDVITPAQPPPAHGP